VLLLEKTVCLVCGMEINNKNFSFNSFALLRENYSNVIEHCPFCGVNKQYLSNDDLPYLSKLSVIDEKTKVIIDHAMKLEIFNGDFYKKVAKIAVNPKLIKMLEELSKIEYMHANVHKKIIGYDSLPVIKDIDYSTLRSDEDILKTARVREEHAVAYYEKYSNVINDKYLSAILSALSVVEKDHINLTSV
jgi:rubrerythrin